MSHPEILAGIFESIASRNKYLAEVTIVNWLTITKVGDSHIEKESAFLCERILDRLDKAPDSILGDIAGMPSNVFIFDSSVKPEQDQNLHALLQKYDEVLDHPEIADDPLTEAELRSLQTTVRETYATHQYLDTIRI